MLERESYTYRELQASGVLCSTVILPLIVIVTVIVDVACSDTILIQDRTFIGSLKEKATLEATSW